MRVRQGGVGGILDLGRAGGGIRRSGRIAGTSRFQGRDGVGALARSRVRAAAHDNPRFPATFAEKPRCRRTATARDFGGTNMDYGGVFVPIAVVEIGAFIGGGRGKPPDSSGRIA